MCAERVDLSIVTVNKDNAAGLAATMASVQQQRGPAVRQWVVVDGGSTDGSAELLAEAGIEPPSRWSSGADGGIYDAMNRGLASSVGRWVVFLNSGDEFEGPHAAQRMVTGMQRAARSWGYGAVKILDASRQPVAASVFAPFNLRSLAVGLRSVPHQGTIMGRDLLDELGGFRTDFGIAADQELILRAAMRCRPEVFIDFFARVEPGGVGWERGSTAYVRDMARARRENGYRGSPAAVDALLGAAIVARAIVHRGIARLT